MAEDLRLFTSNPFLAAMGATGAREETGARRREAVIALLRRNLRVLLPRNSRVVEIDFDSRDPVTAAAVANSYVRGFIYGNLQRRFSTSQYSRDFLETQLASTKARLEQSERALIGYARMAGLVDVSGGGAPNGGEAPRSLVAANLVNLNQAFAGARAARIQAQQRWQEASAVPVMSLPEVLGNPAVQQLTQRRAELQGELEQLRERLKPDHPTVKQQVAQIAALDEQIGELAAGLRASLNNQYRIAAKQERALQGSLASLKGQTLAEQNRGIRYNILKREVDTNRELYNGLLQRFKEVSAEAGITSNNVTVVDVAEPPFRPVSPRPLLIVALALLAGGAVAAGTVVTREYLDDVIRTPGDVEAKLGLPLLGVVPRLRRGDAPMELLDEPRSALVEAHRTVRAALELAAPGGLPRTLLVTSSRQGEGKSLTALALARDIAASGRRTLLVDADLRSPSLHRLLGQELGAGLSGVLARLQAPAEVVVPTALPGLHFLSAGARAPDPGLLLGNGGALGLALAELGARFDAILIDGPPLLALADAVHLAAAVEATLFVVEARGAHHGSAKLACRRLRAAQVRIVGAVLTKYAHGPADPYGEFAYGGAAEPGD